MRFHRNTVTPAKPLPFDEGIDLSSLDYASLYPLLGLRDVHASGEFYKDGDYLVCGIHVEAVARLSDSRTLEPFDMKLSFDDEFCLLKSPDDEEEGYLFEDNNIELSEVVFCAIHTRLPLCPHKKGSALPSSGEGYSVLTEDEFEPIDSNKPFASMEDIEGEND